ncbi:hypothetical protein [Streptomyces sp. AK02-01A]|uniref:hypothetical protein n=1 Tax=Streptomyces sp. AK02-01A TaxID=3028648 RepID=UPI0029BD9226|nr:hypothetical protein [Streptomyces sp. AK02-01A]MDX3853916.1 hypothetical protein [Streptomyces sp. AK02-01A]
MIGLLTEVGKRIATRWFTEVLLPGLLLVAVIGCAAALGHGQALDSDALVAATERVWARLRGHPVRWAVELALAVAAAGLMGIAARGTGGLVQRFWLRERHLLPQPARFTSRRWSRHHRALTAASRHGVEPVRAYLPQRPTWMSDRLRLIEARIHGQYWFSATLAWPRIWLLVSEEVHAPVRQARARFDEACVLAGWSIPYLLVGLYWWPACLIGLTTTLVAWRRARLALDEFATLVESTIDIHWRTLVTALGVTISGDAVTAEEAALIEDRLHKGA